MKFSIFTGLGTSLTERRLRRACRPRSASEAITDTADLLLFLPGDEPAFRVALRAFNPLLNNPALQVRVVVTPAFVALCDPLPPECLVVIMPEDVDRRGLPSPTLTARVNHCSFRVVADLNPEPVACSVCLTRLQPEALKIGLQHTWAEKTYQIVIRPHQPNGLEAAYRQMAALIGQKLGVVTTD